MKTNNGIYIISDDLKYDNSKYPNDKYYDQIYSWSISKTNNKEDAEDLTNNIFLAIIYKIIYNI